MAAHPKAHLWPFVPSSRIIDVVKAEGVWLHLADGTRILDAAGGAIAASIGHGRREVADAMAEVIRPHLNGWPTGLDAEALKTRQQRAEAQSKVANYPLGS